MKFLSKTLLISGAYDCTLKVTHEKLWCSINCFSLCLDLEYQYEYLSSNTRFSQRTRLVIGLFDCLLSFRFTRSNSKIVLLKISSPIKIFFRLVFGVCPNVNYWQHSPVIHRVFLVLISIKNMIFVQRHQRIKSNRKNLNSIDF